MDRLKSIKEITGFQTGPLLYIVRNMFKGDMIIEEVFGPKGYWASPKELLNRKEQIIIEKTFPCDTKISEINRSLRIFLPTEGVSTLEELMISHLGHRPNKGESIKVDQYELTMQEVGVLKGKKISIKTIY